MSTIDVSMEMRPTLTCSLRAGAIAGVAAAALNALWFAAYGAATGIEFSQPTYGSIGASSVAPMLLGAIGFHVLGRLTPRATSIFAATTGLITLASFAGIVQDALPDGTPKPAGFDALVMPMHVVVGAMAAVLLPRLVAACRQS
jgi:hypothetical protein